jgi:raffinose/stachyose/melibiose transport system substrate-binding protein
MHFKFFPQFALLALFCWLTLSGCGSSSSGAGTRTLRIWYSTDDPVERVWSQELARRYEQNHPAVTVNLVDYSFEDLNTKLQLALSAGDPPDLAYVTPRGPGIPAYVGAHKLVDLTPHARRGHWSARLRPGLLSSYNRPFSYQGAKAGEIVGVPMALASAGLLYNRRLLNRLHMSVPSSIAQFEQDLAHAKASGYVPLGLGNADGWLGDDWYLTLVNALVPPAKLAPEQKLSKRFSFRRPAFLSAAKTLQKWSNLGYFTPDFGGLDAQEGVDQFFAGRTLFQLISSSENAQIQRDLVATKLAIGLFPFPATYGGGVMPTTGYLGWVVPKDGKDRADALSFIDSVLTPSSSSFLARQAVLPATRDFGTSVLPGWVHQYLHSLTHSQQGIYLDAVPIANMNATMEANVQLLLQGYEAPPFLVSSLQQVYSSRGKLGSTARIDGEF